MDEINPKPFWRTYTPVSRLGWTTLAFVPMWIVALALFSLCIAFVAIVGLVGYPIMHYIWGMQSSPSAKPESCS